MAPSKSKAQQFALKAEELRDWEVVRERKGERRTVTVTRGQEQFKFRWIRPNLGRDNFEIGKHVVEGIAEPYTNVRAALREMAKPPGSYLTIQPPPITDKVTETTPTNMPGKIAYTAVAKEGNAGPQIVRLPFDPYSASAKEIIESLRGCRITWWNSMANDIETGHVSAHPKQIRIEPPTDPKDWSTRVLTFACSQTGFRSVRLNTIRKVK